MSNSKPRLLHAEFVDADGRAIMVTLFMNVAAERPEVAHLGVRFSFDGMGADTQHEVLLLLVPPDGGGHKVLHDAVMVCDNDTGTYSAEILVAPMTTGRHYIRLFVDGASLVDMPLDVADDRLPRGHLG